MRGQLFIELFEELFSGLFSLSLEELIGGFESGNDEFEH
jgi:hypothetical protein